ncbi:alcohol dehydrogenase catalytic domain-containing protein [Micromonospora sp. STR1s_6]|uniref:Alcohol dehydrogenase catalytic domain-containing protein n=1 Tax=Micromonospora tarensis TaxID=2806100 RepID=A0ABS1YNL8_9ACTN|nr:alcohol dehydrogenase catalytic domain-containing protein [Micromonospora tarensis]MBM0279021.1 alcohol dehydrogenase catalytic domain-containing protein [Micromonospora tarensis]
MVWTPVPVADGYSGAPVVDDLAEVPEPVPPVVVVGPPSGATVREVLRHGLALVQGWLAEERFAGSRLVLTTRHAVATGPCERPDPLTAPLWGLVKAAAAEHPGRFGLADLDDDTALPHAVARIQAGPDAGVAARAGEVLAPRLVPTAAEPIPAGPWHLDITEPGTLENLRLAVDPTPVGPLAAGQVRVAVRAAGLNFRDVMVALGAVPGEAGLGGEGAGVVLETAPDVTGLRPGDRVFGLLPGSFGPVSVTDRRLLAPIPVGWSFAEAATAPIVFLTAYYGLVDLARIRPGETVLVHAAAGGVGMAAVQLAQLLGAEVYATASPAKHAAVRALGVPAERIASSRDLRFEDHIRAPPAGAASTSCSTASRTSSPTPRCGWSVPVAASSRWARPTSATRPSTLGCATGPSTSSRPDRSGPGSCSTSCSRPSPPGRCARCRTRLSTCAGPATRSASSARPGTSERSC